MVKEKKYKWRREDYQENTRGLLMVHTGNGKGKTTSALGLLMRAAGRGLNCCMIQFMKSRNDRYGEHESAEKLGIEVHTMGDGFTWDTKNPEQDIKTARDTWALCVEKLRSGDYDMLVLDELVYVMSYKWLPVEEVVAEFRAIRAAQPALHIIVTGRDAPPELIEAAEKLGIEVHTMGDGFTWDTKNPEQDIKTARDTWALCVEKLRSGDYDMLVFDELVYVLSYKMLPVEEVVAEFRAIRAAQPALHIVVTGRDAPPELIEAADLVTEMTEIKHPFTEGIRAQQGIEF